MTSEDPSTWRTLSVHLDLVLELDAAARELHLADLEQSSPDVASRLRALLASREQPAFEAFLGGAVTLPDLALPASLVGRAIGPWSIDMEIGHGGMGTVWRAHRADGRFESRVAIKFLRAAWLGNAGARRFQQEGSLLGRLDHPNIAKLIDAGVLDGSQPYLVLEFVDGEPLDRYCERRQLNTDAIVRLMLDVLGAVAHAHSQLVVHRDLKPSNVFVTVDGAVKLLDFGISKLLDRDEAGAVPTESGARLLTPEFAAPEQLLGQPVTTATDVYSLGVLLYLLLTGRRPLEEPALAGAALAQAMLTTDPPRPSSVATGGQQRRRELVGDLDNILAKALQKAPGDRYASASAFADDLRRYLTHEPVTARADTPRYRITKFVRRHRDAVLATVAAAMVLLGTTAFALWQMQAAQDERDHARFSAKRADAMGDFLLTLVNDFGRSMSTTSVREQLDRARVLLENQQYDDPMIHVTLLRFLSARYGELGEIGVRAELLAKSIEVLQGVDEPVAQAQLMCSLADVYDDLDRLDEADRLVRDANSRLVELGDIVRPEIRADCRKAESFVATARGENHRALAAANSALSEIEAAGLTKGRQHDTLVNAVARAETEAGQFRAAAARLRGLQESNVAQGLSNTVGALIHERRLASSLLDGGEVRAAAAIVASLVDRGSRLQQAQQSQRDVALVEGRLRLALGDANAAISPLEEARLAAELAPEPDAALVAAIALAEARLLAGDVAGASAERDRLNPLALQSKRRKASALRLDALLEATAGRPDNAERILVESAAVAHDADGQPTPALRSIASTRATLSLARGRNAEACEHAATALVRATSEAVDPQSSAWIGEALLQRAKCAGPSAGREDAATAAVHLAANLGEAHALTVEAREFSAP
jgi:eukaryotic-like serine/threonine-protein kinase